MERWRPIPTYEGRYEVSDLGRVRSVARRQLTANGHWREYRGQMLRPGRSSQAGHVSVALGRSNSQDVHVLVLLAFVGPRPANCEARHKNGNAADNRLANLSWASRRRNSQDKKYHTLPKNQVATPAIVRAIRRGLKTATNRTALARKLGVSKHIVYDVEHRRTHTDV